MVCWSGVVSISVKRTQTKGNAPCVFVEAHNNALHASAIFQARTFGEYLIYLFLSGVKTQVANLRVAVHFLSPGVSTALSARTYRVDERARISF
jgi:hypothetical protein